MTRSIVVQRGSGQTGAIYPGTLVYIKNQATSRRGLEYGYHNLSEVDQTDLMFLGFVMLTVPADQEEYTVIQSGDVITDVNLHDKLKKHDLVKPVIRNGVASLTKAEPFGPASLVEPNTQASEGFGKLVGAISDVVADTLGASAADKRRARTEAATFVRAAMKAKNKIGSRVPLASGVREAQNGTKLMLKAIRSANKEIYGRVMMIDAKKKKMQVAPFKN